MSWLARLLGGTSRADLEGIYLDSPAWVLAGPKSYEELLSGIRDVLPPDSTMYFEGGELDAELRDYFAVYGVPERTHVAVGTAWPRPCVFHVPVSPAAIDRLVEISRRHAEREIAWHFHVYLGSEVLIQWHDAFGHTSILLSDAFTEEWVAALADRFGTSYRRAA